MTGATLNNGATTLTGGARTLTPGATTVTPGATTVTPGATTVTPGATTVTPGATTLTPGATTLKGGAAFTGGTILALGGVLFYIMKSFLSLNKTLGGKENLQGLHRLRIRPGIKQSLPISSVTMFVHINHILEHTIAGKQDHFCCFLLTDLWMRSN